MFPNFRLMLVAMLASIAAIGCGLALFAALRVNHQPFTRLANEDPPLQLVFDHTMPATPAPFGVRFELDASPTGNGRPAKSAVAPGPAAVGAPAGTPSDSPMFETSRPTPQAAAAAGHDGAARRHGASRKRSARRTATAAGSRAQ
ncbi:MAG TPA: hypothetical protein VEK75_15915 [Xanthobacteraceae bacterium]|nr:hypothetical protein [Xanthobacteraceae bacterium]